MSTALNIKRATIFILFIAFIFSCRERDDYASQDFPQDGFVAVYYDSSALINDIEFQTPRRVSNAGKIMRKDSLLLITERLKGVHVFSHKDTTNSPIPLGFIQIPFVQNIDIVSNVLYAQIAKGILQINILDYQNPQYLNIISQRIEDVPVLPFHALNRDFISSNKVFFECLEDNGKWIIAWEVKSLNSPKCFVEF